MCLQMCPFYEDSSHVGCGVYPDSAWLHLKGFISTDRNSKRSPILSYWGGGSGVQHVDPGEENIYQFVKPALSNKNLQNVGKQGVKIVPHKGLLFLAALRNLPHDPVNKLRLLCWIMRDTGSTASMTSCRSATLHNPEPGLSGSWPRWDCSKN